MEYFSEGGSRPCSLEVRRALVVEVHSVAAVGQPAHAAEQARYAAPHSHASPLADTASGAVQRLLAAHVEGTHLRARSNRRVGLARHQAFPHDLVHQVHRHTVLAREIETTRHVGPVGCIVARQDIRAFRILDAGVEHRERRRLQDRRGDGGVAPLAGQADVEDIRHRPLVSGVQVDVRRAEDVLDRAQHAHLVVAGVDDRVLLYVGADHVGGRAVRVDVVGAVLRVILGHDDQGAVGVGAVRHRRDETADREVIVGLLRIGRVHPGERRAEAAGVIMAQADGFKAWEVFVGDVLHELAVPLVHVPLVRIGHVEAAEVDVGQGRQGRVEFRRLHDASLARVFDRIAVAVGGRTDVVHLPAVVPYGQARLQHGIEDVALLNAKRRVGGGDVGGSGKQVDCAAGQVCRGGGESALGGGIARRGRCQTNRRVAIRTLGLIRQAAVDAGVVDLLGHFLGAGDPAAHGPGPAVHAAVAGVHEIIQRDEVAGDAVKVRRDAAAELCQRGIDLRAVGQVAEDLIEGAVFLHDVDHMLDVLVKEVHHRRVARAGRYAVEVVLRHLGGQDWQFGTGRNLRADQRRVFQLELVLVRRGCRRRRRLVAARVGDVGDERGVAHQMTWIWSRVALAVDDVHPRAVRAEGDVLRRIGGRDQARDGVGA